MGTEIRSWQIVAGELRPVTSNLYAAGRTEPYDLEPWIESCPELLGDTIAIIGPQVQTSSGPLDLLGIDRAGNAVIIELKRDVLPREALAQAIDYASDVASWSVEKLSEICSHKHHRSLEEHLAEVFPDIDMESLSFNGAQRILLVGFAIESSLERMIEWLSDHFGVGINAVLLHYTRTANGDELLTRTSIISEELEQERGTRRRQFVMPMSDDPGRYDEATLKAKLVEYLSSDRITNRRVRDVLLPILLTRRVISREDLKAEYERRVPDAEPGKVGGILASVSLQLGRKANDFLRQVISYGYPRHAWEKDDFSLRPEYRHVVEEVLAELGTV